MALTVRAIRWPITILFTIAVFASVMYGVAIQANTDRLEDVVYRQCTDRNIAAASTNEVLETLKHATDKNFALSNEDKASRAVLYDAVKVPILLCTKP